MDKDCNLNIIGSDIDNKAIELARENAKTVGLEQDIKFITKDVRDFILNRIME